MNNLNNIDTELNMSRRELISKRLSPYLSQIFGYNALLYTPLAKSLCQHELSIKNQVVLSHEIKDSTPLPLTIRELYRLYPTTLKCHYEELPIASDCIDLALLPNILQNSTNPHQVLREVERVLIPEGVVIIIGRNPLSWQGLRVIYRRLINKINKNKQIAKVADISQHRILDWFDLLGFKLENKISISASNDKIQNSQMYFWTKKLSQFFCDYFCSYYIVIASKRVSTLTPIKPSWRSSKQFVPPRIAEPSVKAQVENWFQRIKPQ